MHPAAVLVPLVLAQLAVVAGIALEAHHDGWLYTTPDAGAHAWTAARALAHLHVPAIGASYGMAMLVWPLALVTGGNLQSALPAIVVAQAAIGGPVVVLALYGIAARIGGRLFGYLAGLAWVVAPLCSLGWFYAGHTEFEGLAYQDYRADVRDLVVPNALGLTGLADFPSVVALVVAAWLLVRHLDTGDWNDLLLSGLVSGFAVAIEPSNVVFLPAPLLALAVARRPRQALGFAVALLPALATLGLWKQTSGHLPGLGPVPFNRETFRLNLINLKAVGWSVLLIEWIAVAGSFAIVRKAPAKGVLVVAWFLGFFVAGLGRANVRGTGVFRLLEPGYPAFVLLAAAIVLLVPTWGRPRSQPSPPELRPRPTRGLAVGILVLALYPLVLVALASLTPRYRTALQPARHPAAAATAGVARGRSDRVAPPLEIGRPGLPAKLF